MGISLSGRLLPSHLKTCAELVDSVDYLVSTISLGVEYFLDLAQGKHSLLTDPESLIELDGEVFRIHETKLSLMSIETPLERRIPVTDLETQKFMVGLLMGFSMLLTEKEVLIGVITLKQIGLKVGRSGWFRKDTIKSKKKT